MSRSYDLIIVGAGAAGLAAGIYAGRYGLKTAIFDKVMAGGELALTPLIENYPGFKAIAGPELVDLMKEHAEVAGADVREVEEVVDIQKNGAIFRVLTVNNEEFTAKAIILTVGSEPRKLEVPGEVDFIGRGVSYCAMCDAPFFKHKKVLVVGGGNTAVVSAKYLSDLESDVSLVHRRGTTRGEETIKQELIKQNVKFLWNTTVKEIKGTEKVKAVTIDTQGETRDIETDGIFIHIGDNPNNELAKKLGLNLDSEGFVVVNNHAETNIEGIFAAGDITGGILQVSTAVGEGTIAAVNAYLYIKGGWYGEKKTKGWSD
ncbi:MAG: FAD-dependent oxidoreductase [Candidatus Helarchaeota archaeon]|nr:FAD-dependent oxidoreductase [Candidatus Helarchaeota archaeon]